MTHTSFLRAGVALVVAVLSWPAVIHAGDGAEAIELKLRDVSVERSDGLRAHAERVTALTDGPVEAYGLRFRAPVDEQTVTGVAASARGEAAGTVWRIASMAVQIRDAVVSAALAYYNTDLERFDARGGVRFDEPQGHATAERGLVYLRDERVVMRDSVAGTIRP